MMSSSSRLSLHLVAASGWLEVWSAPSILFSRSIGTRCLGREGNRGAAYAGVATIVAGALSRSLLVLFVELSFRRLTK